MVDFKGWAAMTCLVPPEIAGAAIDEVVRILSC